MSLIFMEKRGFENDGMWPCWVDAYIFREQPAAKNLIIMINTEVIIDFLRIAVSKIISLNKLIDGGAAIFHAENINHHIVKIGKDVIIPLVRNMLRVYVISQVKFAKINRADEHSP